MSCETDNQIIIPTSSYQSGIYQGFFKIWGFDPKTGDSKLLIDKKNTIMYQGADLLAMALAGTPNAAISHIYLKYSTTAPGALPTVSKSHRVSDVFTTSATIGGFRIPLAFPAAFTSTVNFEKNIVVFTVIVNGTSGLLLNATPANNSYLYTAGLVAALNPAETPTSHPNDKLFAEITFTPLQYKDTESLTVSWGVKFTA